MDTIREGAGRNEMIAARVLQDNQLWDFEEKLLKIEETFLRVEETSLRKQENVLASAEVNLRHNEEFLRRKERVSRQKEKCWRKREKCRGKREELLKRKERRLEEVLLKFEENCLAGSSLGSEELSAQELLPGIPDNIALCEITTKLSCKEVHLLRSVSRRWYTAIQNCLVYEARVRSHLTDTFILLRYSDSSLALRCLRDNSYFGLPPIPYHDGTRSVLEFVYAVDGKVYVLGGVFDDPSDKVYMLDLVRKRSWTQCASMQTARYDFGCGVMDGKIYVFGGRYFDRYLCESEVYDPKENTWSSIRPMSSVTSYSEVATVGDEFLVLGHGLHHSEDIKFLEIYHPVKDEWRKVEPAVYPAPDKAVFASKGKLYSMDSLGICVHSFDGNLWRQVYSHSFTAIGSVSSVAFRLFSVLVVEDELLVSGLLSTEVAGNEKPCVLRSIGFGTEKKDLTWHEESGWAPHKTISYMGLIHL